jgi:hypothetical protein
MCHGWHIGEGGLMTKTLEAKVVGPPKIGMESDSKAVLGTAVIRSSPFQGGHSDE